MVFKTTEVTQREHGMGVLTKKVILIYNFYNTALWQNKKELIV
jgi:hypothetical protein